MRKTKSLTELRTTGFKPLATGCIHLRCPTCGRKRSNIPVYKDDLPNAFLVESLCQKCSDRTKWDDVIWYDKDGKEIG